MFEERTIPIYTYNIETILAEKLETVMARGTANSWTETERTLYLDLTQRFLNEMKEKLSQL